MNKLDKFFDKDIEKFSRSYFNYLKEIIDNVDTNEIKLFVETLLAARSRGSTIFFMGNGGSAATASHFVNDLSIGTNDYDQPFRVVSLTDNVPTVTALSNDFGYEEIFIRQLRIYSKEGDVLVGISASGNSLNLVKAFEYAKLSGIKTVAITAFNGGQLKSMANEGIHVPTMQEEYGPAEDSHMVLDHLVVSYLMRYIKDMGSK